MWLNARWFFWVLLLFCIFLLVVPSVIRNRYSGGLMVDSESYRSLRFAESVNQNGFLSEDELSYGGKPFLGEQAWFFLLAIAPSFLAKYLPIILGILSFLLFYLVVDQLKPSVKGAAALLLVVAPTFLYMFSSATKYVPAVFFVLLGIYLLLKNKRYTAYASFVAAGLFSVFSLLLVSLFLLYKRHRKREYTGFLFTFVGFVVLFLIYFSKVFVLGLPELFFRVDEFTFGKFFTHLFFVFGSNFGLGFFTFILALVGIHYYYKERLKFIFVYLLLSFALFASFYERAVLFYLIFILAFFAGLGFMVLLNREWRSNIFKFLTILVVLCGLLFTLVVFMGRVGDFYPGLEYESAIDFLSNTGGSQAVFSDYTNGNIISFAGKRNFMDSDFTYAPDIRKRLEDFQTIISSRNIDSTELLMDKYNIEYVLIDGAMKRYVADDEGILFLLANSPLRFSLVFDNGAVRIWQRIDAELLQQAL